MMKTLKLALIIGLVAALFIPSSVALAAFGDTVTSFTPSPAGNGRAIAYDGTDLYYTYYGSTYIYKVDTSGTAIGSWDAEVQIGALAWDSNNGQLWAASYDGLGKVYTVDFGVSKTEQFTFDPETGPHFDGYIDGLDYDDITDTLYISEDWDHKVYHISTTGTILHSWDVTIPGYDYLDNSDIEKVNKWIFVGHPDDTTHGPATNSIFIFELDQNWGLTYTGSYIDAGTNKIEGIALGKYNDQCVLWTNATNNELAAFDLTGYCPVLAVDKWLYEQIDMGDGDGILEVGEEWWFNVVIDVQNVSVAEVTDILLKDNIAGDLLVSRVVYPGSGGWVDVPMPTEKKKRDNVWTDGTVTIEWTGKTKKAHVYFDLGSLAPGESTSVQLLLITDINPGDHQQYTSEGPTELNSGATAKGLLQGWYEVEAVSEPIEVDVQPYVETPS